MRGGRVARQRTFPVGFLRRRGVQCVLHAVLHGLTAAVALPSSEERSKGPVGEYEPREPNNPARRLGSQEENTLLGEFYVISSYLYCV
jgi:hypothetical protein